MIDLSRFKGIIFDMDGTLIDSMGSHMKAWELTCHHFGYPFDGAYMYSLGGVPTMRTAELLNTKYAKDHNPIEVGLFKKQVWEAMDHMPTLIEDTYAVFEYYLSRMKIAVGTGAERAHAEHMLAHHGVLSKLDALVTASDVINGKPSPDTFLMAAREIGLAAEDCVVFEDTDIGRQAATAAGMACVMVINGKVQEA